MAKRALSPPVKEYAKESPLESLALTVVMAVSPSATDKLPGLLMVGAAFGLLPPPLLLFELEPPPPPQPVIINSETAAMSLFIYDLYPKF
jgi:hypothetical protein